LWIVKHKYKKIPFGYPYLRGFISRDSPREISLYFYSLYGTSYS
jgi:hypothetical protein